jgi:dihydroorotase
MRLLLVGGRVLDPAHGVDGIRDVLVENGFIREVAEGLGARVPDGPELRRVDAAGLWVLPGLVDMHVHLREPGREVEPPRPRWAG